MSDTAERPSPRKITVQRFIEEDQLRKDLAFSDVDLDNAMMQHASLFAHYGTLAAKALKQLDDLKLVLEVTQSRVDRSLRDKAAEAGEKTTEAGLEKMVAVHPRVIAIRKAVNSAKFVEGQARAAAEAFRQRRDMLVGTGATRREEMKGEVSISRRAAIEETLEAQKRRLIDGFQKKETA